MMFILVVIGYVVVMVFVRGLVGKKKILGNFYVDLIRIIIRVFLLGVLIIGFILVI